MNSIQAAKAYANVAGIGNPTQNIGSAEKSENAEGAFSEALNQAIENVSDVGAKTEAKALELATGQTDIVDLVTAVAETEVAVQTMVTVRDRVITAYQDILNMPI